MEQPTFASLQPGAIFRGRYHVVRRIKAGAMGAVYEVADSVTNSRRALKVMLPELAEDKDLRERFAREATITGEVDSDHIVRVLDAGIDASGLPFLVMDLLHGEEFGSLLKRRGPLPPSEVFTYLSQVARALDKTHAKGIVHRDLKLGNLFLTSRDDGAPCVKVLDFGIAKVVSQTKGQRTRLMGTPPYMPPEQMKAKGEIGPAADLYALAHIAFTLLVGEPYWADEEQRNEGFFAFAKRVLKGPREAATVRAQRRRGIVLPPAFDAWFRRAAAVCPEDRFNSATAAIAALAGALGLPSRRSPSALDLSVSQTPPPVVHAGAPHPEEGSSPQRGNDPDTRYDNGSQPRHSSLMAATVPNTPTIRDRVRAARPTLLGMLRLIVVSGASVCFASLFHKWQEFTRPEPTSSGSVATVSDSVPPVPPGGSTPPLPTADAGGSLAPPCTVLAAASSSAPTPEPPVPPPDAGVAAEAPSSSPDAGPAVPISPQPPATAPMPAGSSGVPAPRSSASSQMPLLQPPSAAAGSGAVITPPSSSALIRRVSSSAAAR